MSNNVIRPEEVGRLSGLALNAMNLHIRDANGLEVLSAIMSLTYSSIMMLPKEDRGIFRSVLEQMYGLLPTQEVQ